MAVCTRWAALPCRLGAFAALLWSEGSAQGAGQESQVQAPKCDFAQIEIPEECPSASGFDWEAFHQMLYQARALVFLADVSQAERQVHQLLVAATSPFSRAFECPPAVAATYFALAQILAFQGRLRRALAIVHMGFVFIRDKGFSECTPWPLQGWDMMLAGRNLVQKVAELDRPALPQDTPTLRLPQLKIAVVTICAYAEDEPVRVLGTANHQLYTQLHGYDLHMFTDASQILPHPEGRMNVNDGVHKAFFWKVNAVRNVFDSPMKYDWVLWADCDAFFMDPRRTLDSIINLYASAAVPTKPPPDGQRWPPAYEQALQPATPPPVSLILAVDSTGINNGVWLMRNDEWARRFLDHWWHSDILSGAGANHNCSDQSTMQHQLIQQNAMSLDGLWDRAEGPIWPREVRVAAQEHLQSFHKGTADAVISREWQDGDFIRHHPGCHYYQPPCQHLFWEAATTFEGKVQRMLGGAAVPQ